ncbi:hypothetical protein NSU_2782 [Novosphingobium pentaromativorans US6-1]|uniref:Uncharacterized protein n=1 Tax=Novosphingobium pentaromativorans US6-1 TaxID=1088721 RepID=G6EEL1_9SPHN|nr:hypothetical protein NSU_2782 [Novosphingobium pentaromativorans US6-1]
MPGRAQSGSIRKPQSDHSPVAQIVSIGASCVLDPGSGKSWA